MAFRVKVSGAARKIGLLQRFDKEAWRDMQKGVRSAGDLVAEDARGRMPAQPLRNWGRWIEAGRFRDLSYTSGNTRAISVSVRSRETAGFRRVKAKVGFAKGNAAGAIFGLAGSVSGTRSDFPARSANFKANLNRRHGGSMGMRNAQMWPRALTPAYYSKGPQARIDIGAAIERAISRANS